MRHMQLILKAWFKNDRRVFGDCCTTYVEGASLMSLDKQL